MLMKTLDWKPKEHNPRALLIGHDPAVLSVPPILI